MPVYRFKSDFPRNMIPSVQRSMTKLAQNLKDTLDYAIEYKNAQRAVVIFDRDSELASLVADGYMEVLPAATPVNFSEASPDEIFQIIDNLAPGDFVALVQSKSFRLNDFRFRLELFRRGLAVIEHPHLGRMTGEQIAVYIDALAYDPEYYRGLGANLKERIDRAQRVVVECDGGELVYETAMEEAKLNVGDYTEMKNTGGQFPIGEVFTEPVNFEQVNGILKLYAFADATFHVQFPSEPITVVVEKGMIVDTPNAPKEFLAVLDQIRLDERLLIRELGFGMNRAVTRNRRVVDVGAYERMCGIHVSLGHKHTTYTKAGLPKRSSKYHVDVFVDVKRVLIDGEVVFEGGTYLL